MLQKEALSIRLKIEQLDGHIAEHQSKIKHWQKEVIFHSQIVFKKQEAYIFCETEVTVFPISAVAGARTLLVSTHQSIKVLQKDKFKRLRLRSREGHRLYAFQE